MLRSCWATRRPDRKMLPERASLPRSTIESSQISVELQRSFHGVSQTVESIIRYSRTLCRSLVSPSCISQLLRYTISLGACNKSREPTLISFPYNVCFTHVQCLLHNHNHAIISLPHVHLDKLLCDPAPSASPLYELNCTTANALVICQRSRMYVSRLVKFSLQPCKVHH